MSQAHNINIHDDILPTIPTEKELNNYSDALLLKGMRVIEVEILDGEEKVIAVGDKVVTTGPSPRDKIAGATATIAFNRLLLSREEARENKAEKESMFHSSDPNLIIGQEQ